MWEVVLHLQSSNVFELLRRIKMKYMGSKARIAKQILPIMLEEAEKYKVGCWVEPFVGGNTQPNQATTEHTLT